MGDPSCNFIIKLIKYDRWFQSINNEGTTLRTVVNSSINVNYHLKATFSQLKRWIVTTVVRQVLLYHCLLVEIGDQRHHGTKDAFVSSIRFFEMVQVASYCGVLWRVNNSMGSGSWWVRVKLKWTSFVTKSRVWAKAGKWWWWVPKRTTWKIRGKTGRIPFWWRGFLRVRIRAKNRHNTRAKKLRFLFSYVALV